MPIYEPGSLDELRPGTALVGVIGVWNLDPFWSFTARDVELLQLHTDRVSRALLTQQLLKQYAGAAGPSSPPDQLRTPRDAEQKPLRIFLSYSRTDTNLVDQLEADLKRAGLQPWVDRRRLEGGQEWLDEIQNAIERCDALAVVLTPQAVQSQYVRMEWRHAKRMRKRVIPLLYKLPPRMPIDLAEVQWVDFQHDYMSGLKDLLAALQ